MMNLKTLTGHSRASLCKQRLELVAFAKAEGEKYYAELPAAAERLAAAKHAAMWPANQFPSAEMSSANAALIMLNDRHADAIAGFAKSIEPIETELREGTSYDVGNFISDLVADMDASRRKFASVVERKTNPVTGKRADSAWTNAQEISDRVEKLFAAKDYADTQLRYVENLKDLPAEFAKIRASLPFVPTREIKAEDHARGERPQDHATA